MDFLVEARSFQVISKNNVLYWNPRTEFRLHACFSHVERRKWPHKRHQSRVLTFGLSGTQAAVTSQSRSKPCACCWPLGYSGRSGITSNIQAINLFLAYHHQRQRWHHNYLHEPRASCWPISSREISDLPIQIKAVPTAGLSELRQEWCHKHIPHPRACCWPMWYSGRRDLSSTNFSLLSASGIAGAAAKTISQLALTP